MTKEDLDLIAGLVDGVETAIVHLVNLLDSRNVLSREVVAASFRQAALDVPADLQNRARVALVLDQIARGIEQSSVSVDSEIRRLLQ